MPKRNKKRRRPLPSTPKLVRILSELHAEGLSRLDRQLAELATALVPNKSGTNYTAVLYLIEKVRLSSLNASYLHRKNPFSCHAEIAAISRGIFEAAVNCLYLLDDDGDSRIAAFWLRSYREEKKINDQLQKWTDCSNGEIAEAARSEYEVMLHDGDVDETNFLDRLGIANRRTEKWPTLLERAKLAGEIWHYFYDVRYRSYSTWQHGDLSRMVLSPGMVSSAPNLKERSLTEGLSILSWCFELMYQFVKCVNDRCGTAGRLEKIDDMHKLSVESLKPYWLLYRKNHPTDKEVLESVAS